MTAQPGDTPGAATPWTRLVGLAGGTDTDAVLSLMAAIAHAAIAADCDLVLPSDLSQDEGGHLVLQPSDRGALLPGDAVMMAPEVAHSGPTPAALVFSIAAIGAGVALGSWSPPPQLVGAHGLWIEELVLQLRHRWEDSERRADAIDLLARCLQADPFGRPHPRHLVEALEQLGARRPRPGMARSSRTSTRTLAARVSSSQAVEGWLRRLIAVVLLLSVLLVASASCGLAALYADGLAQSVPSPVSEPEPLAGAAQVPAPAPATLPPEPSPPVLPALVVPAEVPVRPTSVASEPVASEPVASEPAVPRPTPEPGEELENDLIDPWR